jgi:hypothetical protein
MNLEALAVRIGDLDANESVVFCHDRVGVAGAAQPFDQLRQVLGRLEAELDGRRRTPTRPFRWTGSSPALARASAAARASFTAKVSCVSPAEAPVTTLAWTATFPLRPHRTTELSPFSPRIPSACRKRTTAAGSSEAQARTRSNRVLTCAPPAGVDRSKNMAPTVQSAQ